jgi:TonB family protein
MKHTKNPDSAQDWTASQRYRKQRQNSPWFWVQLLGGSMVVHGIVLTIALPIAARLSASANSSPTPVEFVELSEPAPPAETTPPTEAAPAEPAPAEPIQPAPAPEPIPPSSIGFAPEPSPINSPTPSPEASPVPSPEASPMPEVPAEIPAEIPAETAALPSPQPESLPLPVLPSPTASPSPQPEQAAVPSPEPVISEASPGPEAPELPPEPERPPDRPALSESDTVPGALRDRAQPEVPDPQPTSPEPQPTEPGLQTTPIDEAIPDVSERIAAAPSTVDTDDLDTVNNQATAPTGVTLSLTGTSRVAPGGGAPVETLEIARPIASSMTFLPDPSTSACQVTPDILNRAGTPIALQIATDEQGNVLNASVNQSSGSPEYDQLAVCLVQEQWRFEPATALNAGETERQPIASDELQITITINRN